MQATGYVTQKPRLHCVYVLHLNNGWLDFFRKLSLLAKEALGISLNVKNFIASICVILDNGRALIISKGGQYEL